MRRFALALVIPGCSVSDPVGGSDVGLDGSSADGTLLDSTVLDSTAEGSGDVSADAMAMDADAGADAASDVVDASDAGADASDANDGGVASSCKYAPVNQTCNTLPVGPLVNIGCTGAPPSPQGGTVLDGYYELTKMDYDSDAGCYANQTRKSTIEVCGSDMVWKDYDTNNSSWLGALTWSTQNTTWSMTQVCPSADNYSFEYTATMNGLVIFFQYPMGARMVMTFTKK